MGRDKIMPVQIEQPVPCFHPETMPESINQPEEEIRTRLTGIFHYLKVQAVETNLLCLMDVEALNKLARYVVVARLYRASLL